MAPGNHTQVTEFILMGISDRPELQIPLSCVPGHLWTDCNREPGNRHPHQHGLSASNPHVIFLWHLAITNLDNSSVIAPKTLVNFLVTKKTISYYACAAQLSGFIALVVAEIFVLAAVAYDRCVAICSPLLYQVVVSPRICLLLVALIHVCSLTTALTFFPVRFPCRIVHPMWSTIFIVIMSLCCCCCC